MDEPGPACLKREPVSPTVGSSGDDEELLLLLLVGRLLYQLRHSGLSAESVSQAYHTLCRGEA
jgi:hypothetical protein